MTHGAMSPFRVTFESSIQVGQFSLWAPKALMNTVHTNLPKNYWTGVFFIVLLGFLLRIQDLDKSIWIDEWSSIYRLQLPLTTLLSTDINNFCYLSIMKVWSYIGNSIEILRFFSALAGTFTILFLILWLRPQSWLASFLGGTMCAVLPAFLESSGEIRNYALLTLLSTVAFFLGHQIFALKRGSWVSRLYFFALLLLIPAIHLIGLIVIPMVLFYVRFLVAGNLKSFFSERWVLLFTIFGVALGFFSAVYFKSIGADFIQNWWMHPPSLQMVHFVMADTFRAFDLVVAFGLNWGAIPCYLLMGLMVFVPSLFGDWKQNLPILLSGGIFLFIMLAVSFFIVPIIWHNTLLPLWIPIIGSIAMQIATIKRLVLRRRVCIGSFTVSALFMLLWLSTSDRPRENWKGVAQYLDNSLDSQSAILSSFRYNQILKYYSPGLSTFQMPPAAGPWTWMYEEQLLRRLVKYERVFVVVRRGGQDSKFMLGKGFRLIYKVPGAIQVHLWENRLVKRKTYSLSSRQLSEMVPGWSWVRGFIAFNP